MERNKKLTIALPVLLGIAICVWLPNLNPSASKSHGEGNTKASKDLMASHHEAVSLIKGYSAIKTSRKTAMAWGERNPFDAGLIDKNIDNSKQGNTTNKSAVKYDLSGIFWNERKPSALINDSVIDVGSVVGSSTVREISPDKVILFDGAKDIVLILRQN